MATTSERLGNLISGIAASTSYEAVPLLNALRHLRALHDSPNGVQWGAPLSERIMAQDDPLLHLTALPLTQRRMLQSYVVELEREIEALRDEVDTLSTQEVWCAGCGLFMMETHPAYRHNLRRLEMQAESRGEWQQRRKAALDARKPRGGGVSV